MHEKAAASKADAVMLDLEDSVPLSMKETARETVAETLNTLDFGNKTVCVRINALDTPFAFRDVIRVVEAAGSRLNTLVVPKVNREADIHFVSHLLAGLESECGLDHPIPVQASIETAEGLDRIREIAASDPRINALVFGIADYQVSIGASLVSISGHGENEAETYPGHRWHYPLSRMVMAAKANGQAALDAPFGNFRDTAGLAESAALARALGCDGKWVIHPAQIDPVNQVFTPGRAEISRARQILDAMESRGKDVKGAISVDGRMVDLATVRLAQKVWNQAVSLNPDLAAESD